MPQPVHELTPTGTALVLFASPSQERIADALRDLRYRVDTADTVEAALTRVRQGRLQVVVADATMVGVLNGVDFATQIATGFPNLPMVLVDHFDGRLTPNVISLDKPWRLEDVTRAVLEIAARCSGLNAPA